MELRPLPLLLISVAASAAAGALAAVLVAPSTAPQTQAAGPSEDSRVSAALSQLEVQQRELAAGLDELRGLAAASSGARSEVGDVDAAVARYMQAHQAELARAGESAVAAAAGAQKPKAERVAEALAQLQQEDLSDVERQRLWREFAKDGLGDELLAEFERLAELDPNDPDKKVDLAGAYFLKITEVGNSPEAGLWATKADKVLDQALALDENHWEARFSKAVSLSFWPPVFGKQQEAIAQFETLVAQQSKQAKQEHFAQTHLLLGNMYQQTGQIDKALAAWQNGLAQFPGDADLQKQIDLHGTH